MVLLWLDIYKEKVWAGWEKGGRMGGLAGRNGGREGQRTRERKLANYIRKVLEQLEKREKKSYYKFFSYIPTYTNIQTETQIPYNPKGAAFPRWMFW